MNRAERLNALLDPDFRIHFGAPVDPRVDGRRARTGRHGRVHRPLPGVPRRRPLPGGPPADERERTAFLWSAALPDARRVSGIDLAVLAGDRIREVWSVTGARRLPEVPAP